MPILRPSWRWLSLLLLSFALAACVFLPATTSEYDPDCGIHKRHMVLQPYQVTAFYGCQNEGCIELLVLAGAVTASSLVISGSVAVVGDMVYWLEAQRQCARQRLGPR